MYGLRRNFIRLVGTLVKHENDGTVDYLLLQFGDRDTEAIWVRVELRNRYYQKRLREGWIPGAELVILGNLCSTAEGFHVDSFSIFNGIRAWQASRERRSENACAS